MSPFVSPIRRNDAGFESHGPHKTITFWSQKGAQFRHPQVTRFGIALSSRPSTALSCTKISLQMSLRFHEQIKFRSRSIHPPTQEATATRPSSVVCYGG